MRTLFCVLLALSTSSRAIEASSATSSYQKWLDAQIAQARRADSGSVLEIVWRHQQCGSDRACHARIDANPNVDHASPVLLALLRGATEGGGTQGASVARWTELASIDSTNSYPLAVTAALQWKLGDSKSALDQLAHAIARPRFDDYYAAMAVAVNDAITAHPPSANEMAPCALVGEKPEVIANPKRRIDAAANDVLGNIGFPRLGDVLALCKTNADPADAARRTLCEQFGRTMETQATTWLSQNIGLALRRASTEDASAKASYALRQHDNLIQIQRATWWMNEASEPAREGAFDVWHTEFARSGELHAFAAINAKYGEPPLSGDELQARWNERMSEGQACYAKHAKNSNP